MNIGKKSVKLQIVSQAKISGTPLGKSAFELSHKRIIKELWESSWFMIVQMSRLSTTSETGSNRLKLTLQRMSPNYSSAINVTELMKKSFQLNKDSNSLTNMG